MPADVGKAAQVAVHRVRDRLDSGNGGGTGAGGEVVGRSVHLSQADAAGMY